MILVTCKVCLKEVPADFAHVHHEKPQAAGGSTEDEVDLCTQCHTNVHAVASMLGGKRAHLAEDTVNAFYTNYGDRKRCFELANLVVKWMIAKKTGQIKTKPEEDVDLIITIPYKVKAALAVIAAGVKHKDSNRKAGMSSLAAQVICNFVYAEFPDLRQDGIPAIKESNNHKIIKEASKISATKSPLRKNKKIN